MRKHAVGDANIFADDAVIHGSVRFGSDVTIRAKKIVIEDGASVGVEEPQHFRVNGGVLIECDEFVLRKNGKIGRGVFMRGGRLEFGPSSTVKDQCTIQVMDSLLIGERGTIHEHVEMAGRLVHIGQECWILPHAKIGGGSAFDAPSRLVAGHYFHLGLRGFINTARAVEIGHEVGLGTGTSLYTHGAYPSELRGAPVAFAPITVGNFAWLPGAIVNPGVNIGAHCVVGVGSVVNKDLPRGCMAAGIPAKILKESVFPKVLTPRQQWDVVKRVISEVADNLQIIVHEQSERVDVHSPTMQISLRSQWSPAEVESQRSHRVLWIVIGDVVDPGVLPENHTLISLSPHLLRGKADGDSHRVVDQLRRHGIRFYQRNTNGLYAQWAGLADDFYSTLVGT